MKFRNLIFLLSVLFINDLTSQIVVHEENFSNCASIEWTSVASSEDTDDNDFWECISAGGLTFMEMNGLGGGVDDEWLVSPSLDLSSYQSVYMNFSYKNIFQGQDIRLYVSQDYDGSGSEGLDAASWNEIELELIDIFEEDKVFNPLHTVSREFTNLNFANIHFAIRYQNLDDDFEDSETWEIHEFRVTADYYSAVDSEVESGLRCRDLKSELHQLINNHRRIEYTSDQSFDVWDAYYTTDVKESEFATGNVVWAMSSDDPQGLDPYEFILGADQDVGNSTGQEGVYYNREHVFPKSWWGGGTEPSDTQYYELHNLVPSDKLVNEIKLNYPLGEASASTVTENGTQVGLNTTSGYSGLVYEPINEFKGDYARMYFYMATRYENIIADWEFESSPGNATLTGDNYEVYENWIFDILMDWHQVDPVSQKEIDRNNAIYSIQKNRNPFVDRPYFVEMIWGTDDLDCEEVTGTEELSQFAFKVYPNPAFEYLIVESEEEVYKLEIVTVNGTAALSHTKDSNNFFDLNISQIKSGTYFVKLYTEKGVAVQKLIISK